MSKVMRIALAQLDFLVGDVAGNTDKIIDSALKARNIHKADIIVFPELCLCGYPPEDLLFRESLHSRIKESLERIALIKNIVMVVGAPIPGEKGLENRAIVFFNGNVLCQYAKRELPNYTVFDEKRYFIPGTDPDNCVFTHKGITFGLAICEDLWMPDTTREIIAKDADIILSLNASPYDSTKASRRLNIMQKRCKEAQRPLVYVNLVGAQDELVFDGGSFVMNSHGQSVLAAEHYQEDLYLADYNINLQRFNDGYKAPEVSFEENLYQALVSGVRDYVCKNGFKGAILGLSGGIDSAMVLAIAVDALGKDQVEAVMMPFHYTSQLSVEAAEKQAKMSGVKYQVLPIAPAYDGFTQILENEFKGLERDVTEENLQARCRGMILMAISNKTGKLVLTTGNKSELSVGYATLYGDMAGGFCVLKDVPKTLVYQLAAWRNRQSSAIPQEVITRPPSAELAPDQKDQDALPPYEVLDEILRLYIEEDKSAKAIIAKGFDNDIVYRVLNMVDASEYKRRQAPVGVKITSRAFGRDRRYPITSGWKNRG